MDVTFDPDDFVLGEPDREAAVRALRGARVHGPRRRVPRGARRPRSATTRRSSRRRRCERWPPGSRRRATCRSTPRRPTSPRRGPPRRDVVRPRAGRGFLPAPPPRLPGRARPRSRSTRRSAILRGRPRRSRASGRSARTSSTTSSSSAREGIALGGIDIDTMVLSYLLEPNWGTAQPRPAGHRLPPTCRPSPIAEVTGRARARSR